MVEPRVYSGESYESSEPETINPFPRLHNRRRQYGPDVMIPKRGNEGRSGAAEGGRDNKRNPAGSDIGLQVLRSLQLIFFHAVQCEGVQSVPRAREIYLSST